MSEDRLRRWLEEEHELLERRREAEARAATGARAARDPASFASRPGIDLLQAMLAGELAQAPMAQTLEYLLIEVQPGRAVFQGRPGAHHYNPLGSVHGGWFATLLDSAVGCAVHTTMPPGKGYTTLELKVNMVRALTENVSRVRAEGRTVHVGSQIATAEGRLVGPDGKLYAHSTTTCLVFDLPSGTVRVPAGGRQADG